MTLYICYHGTSKENADSIMKTGFKKWTYFAKHLEDSLGYGGEYVFEVMFSSEDYHIPDFWEDKNKWQFINHEEVSPTRIVGLTKYNPKEIYDSAELRKKVFESNINQSSLRTTNKFPNGKQNKVSDTPENGLSDT